MLCLLCLVIAGTILHSKTMVQVNVAAMLVIAAIYRIVDAALMRAARAIIEGVDRG
jgi:hypothetical protein